MVADIMEAVKTLLADLGKAPAAKDMALVCALYRRLGDTLPSAIAQADP